MFIRKMASMIVIRIVLRMFSIKRMDILYCADWRESTEEVEGG